MAGNPKDGESDRRSVRSSQDAVLEENVNDEDWGETTDVTWSEELAKLREVRQKVVERAREVAVELDRYVTEELI
jgi:hypothetical protein